MWASEEALHQAAVTLPYDSGQGVLLDAFSDRGGEKGWTRAEPFSMKDSGCEECGG